MRDLGYVDVKPILEKLQDLKSQLVLVGGQAVNFWADYYASRVPELAADAPYTSKDIDFCGDRRAVRICAERLHGKAIEPEGPCAPPQSGLVIFVDDEGNTRQLDVVDRPYGLESGEVERLAIPAVILNDDGSPTGSEFLMMHPVLSLKSRVHNVIGLAAQYDNPQGLKQLRAAIVCAREFLRDILANEEIPSAKRTRVVLGLNERISALAMHADGLDVFIRHSMDVMSGMLVDDALPDAFRAKRLPQLMAKVEEKRRSRARRA